MLDPQQVASAAVARFGEPSRAHSTRTELRFGRKGSVAVCLSGPKAGGWYSHESGEGGYLVEGPAAPRAPAPLRPRFRREPDRADALDAILAACADPHGTAVEAYLSSRGIEPPYPRCIRACVGTPGVPQDDGGLFYAARFGMAALAQDGAGNALAVQVVALTAAGAKADLPVVKRTFRAGSDWNLVAAVRLPGRGRLILAEGVETALSIWRATGRPVWCTLGTANLARINVWPRKGVTIARDGDAPGSDADRAVGRAIAEQRARGVEVRVAAPPPGSDWQDVHRRDGLDAVARAFRGGGR